MKMGGKEAAVILNRHSHIHAHQQVDLVHSIVHTTHTHTVLPCDVNVKHCGATYVQSCSFIFKYCRPQFILNRVEALATWSLSTV